MRLILATSLSALTLLAACDRAQEPDTAPSPAPVVAAADGNAPAPANRAPSAATSAAAPNTPAPTPASQPSVTQGTVSCTAELGPRAARQLVRQCLAVSPATHPPCNVQNSCAMIRSEINRACSVIDDGTHTPNACPAVPTTAGAAVEVIRTYYAAIDARDYVTAWQLWGDDGKASGKSLDAFRAGFATTVSSSVSPGTPSDPEGAAGSSYVTVPVTVTARLSNGSRQRFTGSYVLRRSNVERSQGWSIYSAKLRPAG